MWEVKLRTIQDDGSRHTVLTRPYRTQQYALAEARELVEAYSPQERDEWLTKIEELGRGASTSARSV